MISSTARSGSNTERARSRPRAPRPRPRPGRPTYDRGPRRPRQRIAEPHDHPADAHRRAGPGPGPSAWTPWARPAGCVSASTSAAPSQTEVITATSAAAISSTAWGRAPDQARRLAESQAVGERIELGRAAGRRRPPPARPRDVAGGPPPTLAGGSAGPSGDAAGRRTPPWACPGASAQAAPDRIPALGDHRRRRGRQGHADPLPGPRTARGRRPSGRSAITTVGTPEHRPLQHPLGPGGPPGGLVQHDVVHRHHQRRRGRPPIAPQRRLEAVGVHHLGRLPPGPQRPASPEQAAAGSAPDGTGTTPACGPSPCHHPAGSDDRGSDAALGQGPGQGGHVGPDPPGRRPEHLQRTQPGTPSAGPGRCLPGAAPRVRTDRAGSGPRQQPLQPKGHRHHRRRPRHTWPGVAGGDATGDPPASVQHRRRGPPAGQPARCGGHGRPRSTGTTTSSTRAPRACRRRRTTRPRATAPRSCADGEPDADGGHRVPGIGRGDQGPHQRRAARRPRPG